MQCQIKRWDSVLIHNKDQPQPMIYVFANQALRHFCHINNYKVYVSITGTGVYDKAYTATVHTGSFPTPRPNFYANTGDWILVLDCLWNGYPNALGTATIVGDNGEI